jgi:hypothetical protein
VTCVNSSFTIVETGSAIAVHNGTFANRELVVLRQLPYTKIVASGATLEDVSLLKGLLKAAAQRRI